MARQISVSDEVYELLTKRKGGRSYSAVIKDMANQIESPKGDIMRFAGALKGDKQLAKIQKLIAEDRRRNVGRKFKW
ncbi:MAG TPA: antitoxin VapB family protein [Candidatus Acidoferrales bacterium]|nr:antitoxin VapB family protein [Candidatus Acidoferrales bacterium]